jgi:hypothetical protein
MYQVNPWAKKRAPLRKMKGDLGVLIPLGKQYAAERAVAYQKRFEAQGGKGSWEKAKPRVTYPKKTYLKL